MKARFLILASALLSAAMLFSCTEKIDIPTEDTGVYDYVITAYSEDSSTKVELNEDKYILWKKDDSISVLSMANDKFANDVFTLTDGEQTTIGTFGGTLSNEEMPHVGVYPYREDNMYGVNGSISWGKSVQVAVDGGFDPEACLMAGRMRSDGKISFKNLCSYIKFETDFACTSIEITSKDKCFVSDRIVFLLDSLGMPSSIAPDGFGNQYQTVTLAGRMDESGKSEVIPAGTYYIAVLPQEYSGLTFTFHSEFGTVINKSTREDAKIPINRSSIVYVGTFLLDKLLGDATSLYGSGTKDDPYLISSLEKLRLLESQLADHDHYGDLPYTKDTYFLQTKDIDCEGKAISIGSMRYEDEHPVGTVSYYSYPFTGIYDGGGYKIYNYKLKTASHEYWNYAGLFSNIYQGTIQNLTVAPATTELNEVVLESGSGNGLYAGALLGYAGRDPKHESTGEDADVNIINCHLVGGPYGISCSQQRIVFGGLVGRSDGENIHLKNCSNESSLSTYTVDSYMNAVGGLIGEVSLSSSGEIAGYAPHLVIDRCRNNGSISAFGSGTPCFAGGMVGFLSNYWHNLEAHVSNSVNSGSIMTSTDKTNEDTYWNISQTSGSSCAGGFFGFLDKDTSTSYFHNCLNKGDIYAYTHDNLYARAGGFIGYSKENNNTSQDTDQDGSGDHVYAAMCVNIGSISGYKNNVGSFCGTINGIKCVNCLWLDEHNYSEGVRAILPYRPGLDDQAGGTYDSAHDDYFFSNIDTGIITAAFKKMADAKENGGRECLYDSDKFQLRWGTLDEWKRYAVAWKGEAKYNGTKSLDLDFSNPIAQ